MLRFSLPNDRTLIAVRPLTQFGRVAPALVLAVFGLWLTTKPNGWFWLAGSAFLLLMVLAGALRVLVLVRPGGVRPGFGRRWFAVTSQVWFEVRPGPVGKAGRIVLVGGERERTIIVCAAPMWDSVARHESKMAAACNAISRAARCGGDSEEP